MNKLIKEKIIDISAVIIFILSLLQLSWGLYKALGERIPLDFSVYYQSAQMFLRGFNPYKYLYIENIPFNYPPSFFLFSIFFLTLPKGWAAFFFTLLSFILLLASGYILLRSTVSGIKGRVILLVLSALMQNFPSKLTLVLGQINMVILFLLILSYIMEQKNRWLLSGVFFGLAAMWKITPLMLGIYFICRKKWKIFITGILFFIVSNSLFFIFFPQTRIFLLQVTPDLIKTYHIPPPIYDQSIKSLFVRLYPSSANNNTLAFIASLFLSILVIWKFWYKAPNSKTPPNVFSLKFFSLILILMTITNSFAWQHHLVFLFPGFIVAVLIFLRQKRLVYGVCLFISAVAVASHLPSSETAYLFHEIIQSHSLIGALILYMLLLLSK